MAPTRTAAGGMEPALLSSVAGDAEALLDAGRRFAVSPPVTNPDGSVTHFLGDGVKAHTVPGVDKVLPAHVAQAETMIEEASFVGYVTAYKSATAIARASLAQRSIVAVLDYHGRAREGVDAAVPGHGSHVVTLNCPFDLDYAKWRGMFGKPHDQKQFAEFIEDSIHTIGAPPAADLLEAVADLRIERAVRFKSARNDRNGNISFAYEEIDGERVSGGEVTLPDHVEIVVPIFQGGPLQQLTAKLRFAMDKGVVAFRLVVPGLDKIERDAFRAIGARVGEATGTPVFYTA
jgi:uncharacterized protein YfdQ (DUF2303 family)